MYTLPPSHPRYQLIATHRVEHDIDILIYDSLTQSHYHYLQSKVKKIKNKELLVYLFSIRKNINDGFYELDIDSFEI